MNRTRIPLMTRICADNNKLKIREDQCNPRHPRSMTFWFPEFGIAFLFQLARPDWRFI